MTKIYVTKYALTTGPFSADAEVSDDGGFASYKTENSWGSHYAHGKEFHLTREEALADCERRRKGKLVSIEKQRKKLEAMKFEIED